MCTVSTNTYCYLPPVSQPEIAILHTCEKGTTKNSGCPSFPDDREVENRDDFSHALEWLHGIAVLTSVAWNWLCNGWKQIIFFSMQTKILKHNTYSKGRIPFYLNMSL